MADPCSEQHLVARHQNRLRDALAKLSDVCTRNSKLTETVASKSCARKTVTHHNNIKPVISNRPPTPPKRTVSLLRYLFIFGNMDVFLMQYVALNYFFHRVKEKFLPKSKPQGTSNEQLLHQKVSNDNRNKREANNVTPIINNKEKHKYNLTSTNEKSAKIHGPFFVKSNKHKDCKNAHATDVLNNESLKEVQNGTFIDSKVGQDLTNVVTSDTGHSEYPEHGEPPDVRLNNCENVDRIRRSLENISIPSWYKKYEKNNIDKSSKWRRSRNEENYIWSINYKCFSKDNLSFSFTVLTKFC